MGGLTRELILLGQGPSMDGCPFDVETWSSCSVLGKEGWEDSPVSKVFIFDKPDLKPDESKGVEIARARGISIVGISWYFMKGKQPVISPVTEEFPLREVFAKWDTHYYRNDLTFMIMLALLRGYTNLHLWGVDQGGGPKEIESIYTMALPYVMYWLGVATGMGVEWDVCPNSILLRDD